MCAYPVVTYINYPYTLLDALPISLKNCLVGKGYQEFPLTSEQAAHLATLQKGSNAYLEYLYKLGSDAEIDRKSTSLNSSHLVITYVVNRLQQILYLPHISSLPTHH